MQIWWTSRRRSIQNRKNRNFKILSTFRHITIQLLIYPNRTPGLYYYGNFYLVINHTWNVITWKKLRVRRKVKSETIKFIVDKTKTNTSIKASRHSEISLRAIFWYYFNTKREKKKKKKWNRKRENKSCYESELKL